MFLPAIKLVCVEETNLGRRDFSLFHDSLVDNIAQTNCLEIF